MDPADPDTLAGATAPPRLAVAGALAFVAGPGRPVGRADEGGAETDPGGFVCPFCGETYAWSRRRCASCGGLPVVPREDREVYEAVVGLCGPDCETAARWTDRSTESAQLLVRRR